MDDWPFADFLKWPTLAQYNERFQHHQSSPCWQWVQFVPEGVVDGPWSRYEARIHFHRQVPTRVQNWHDCFNYFIWLSWPKTKWALNERTVIHYMHRPHSRFKKRDTVQNQLARFDECGLVICADKEMLHLIRTHQWHTLFVENREAFHERVKFKIFGHAMYEKLLNPYIGLTGFALLIEPDGSMDWDTQISEMIRDKALFHTAGDLQPFPLLGVPGYYPENEDEHFYANKQYFRPQRSLV